MENIKKWNKEAILSVISMVLLIVLATCDRFSELDLPFNFTSNLDFYTYWHFGWWRTSDIFFYISDFILAILLFFSIYFGIKAIIKTKSGLQKGRMLGIISLIVSLFLLVLVVISFLLL